MKNYDTMAAGGPLDPLGGGMAVEAWLAGDRSRAAGHVRIVPISADPDDLTLRQARALANADRVLHHPGVPAAILERARADAVRLPWPGDGATHGLTVEVEMA